jgi:hypothetical protein
MERVIIVEGNTVLYFDAAEKRKTHAVPYGFQGRLRGFREVPKASLRESAKRYRRSTCQRSSRGVATRATGKSGGGVVGVDLHRYVQT